MTKIEGSGDMAKGFDTDCDNCGRQTVGLLLFEEYKGRKLDVCYSCYKILAQKEIKATKEMFKK